MEHFGCCIRIFCSWLYEGNVRRTEMVQVWNLNFIDGWWSSSFGILGGTDVKKPGGTVKVISF